MCICCGTQSTHEDATTGGIATASTVAYKGETMINERRPTRTPTWDTPEWVGRSNNYIDILESENDELRAELTEMYDILAREGVAFRVAEKHKEQL